MITGSNHTYHLKTFKLFFRHVAQFWSQVSPQFTWKLSESWAYGFDLEVFEYSIEEYFKAIGLPEYLDQYE